METTFSDLTSETQQDDTITFDRKNKIVSVEDTKYANLSSDSDVTFNNRGAGSSEKSSIFDEVNALDASTQKSLENIMEAIGTLSSQMNDKFNILIDKANNHEARLVVLENSAKSNEQDGFGRTKKWVQENYDNIGQLQQISTSHEQLIKNNTASTESNKVKINEIAKTFHEIIQQSNVSARGQNVSQVKPSSDLLDTVKRICRSSEDSVSKTDNVCGTFQSTSTPKCNTDNVYDSTVLHQPMSTPDRMPSAVRNYTTEYNEGSHFEQSGSFSRRKNLPKIVLPCYDGISLWRPFEMIMENIKAQYELNDFEMANIFSQCLKGQPLSLFTDMDIEDKNSWHRASKIFRQWYGYNESPETFQLKLATLKQSSEKSLLDFANEVQSMAALAYPGQKEIVQRQSAQAFLRGITNKQAALWTLQNKNPQTVIDALNAVRGFIQNSEFILAANQEKCRSRSPSPVAESAVRYVRSPNQSGSSSNYQSRDYDRYRDRSRNYDRRSRDGDINSKRDTSGSRSRFMRESSPVRKNSSKGELSPVTDNIDIKDLVKSQSILLEKLLTKISVDDNSSIRYTTNNHNYRDSRGRSPSPSRSPGRSRSSSTESLDRMSSGRCFKCGELGHYAKSCKRKVSFDFNESQVKERGS